MTQTVGEAAEARYSGLTYDMPCRRAGWTRVVTKALIRADISFGFTTITSEGLPLSLTRGTALCPCSPVIRRR